MMAEQWGTMEHKDNHQVPRDDEHCQEENYRYFQQAGVEVLGVADVQQAEGFCAMVQLSSVHLVGSTIRVVVPSGPNSAKTDRGKAAPDRHGGGVHARCMPYQQQHEPLVCRNPLNNVHTCDNTILRTVTY